nr:EamA family transporter [uncultured Tyzzerella sp.]
MWFLLALCSAIFASLTSILAKIGINGINSTLATAIRTTIVLIMSWGIVFTTNTQNNIATIERKSWIFLVLSGISTGISWLFYYKAIQLGKVSKVIAIDKLSIVITLIFSVLILNEGYTIRSIIGCLLIVLGTLFMTL